MCCCYIRIIFVLVILIIDNLPYFPALNAGNTLFDQLKFWVTQQKTVYNVDCSTVPSSHLTNQLLNLRLSDIIPENENISFFIMPLGVQKKLRNDVVWLEVLYFVSQVLFNGFCEVLLQFCFQKAIKQKLFLQSR